MCSALSLCTAACTRDTEREREREREKKRRRRRRRRRRRFVVWCVGSFGGSRVGAGVESA